jgi:hypothetical protein
MGSGSPHHRWWICSATGRISEPFYRSTIFFPQIAHLWLSQPISRSAISRGRFYALCTIADYSSAWQ